jgi:demethylmenaquinone methyltransferase/2-methoxy-6-polyprenyl-1,4-benzoquinol methylase
MARIAVSKLRDPRVEVLCGDVEELALPRRYDCCVVYNAFPHFAHPPAAGTLIRLPLPGGRLTVAHGMSLAALHRHHAGAARGVSRPMLEPERLAALMPPCLAV